jgi:hypothetical protein
MEEENLYGLIHINKSLKIQMNMYSSQTYKPRQNERELNDCHFFVFLLVILSPIFCGAENGTQNLVHTRQPIVLHP